jgi:Cdc6-like AAA superfamily ATPase
MKSKIIESIFEDYLNKEKTNYALLINGKWGSGKTFLWKNVLEKKAIEKKFEPIYISLNGINDVGEIEGILLSKALKLDNPIINNSLKFLRNGINVVGNIIGGGSKLNDITKGINLNFDLSNMLLCFDDLERCSLPIKEILGLINTIQNIRTLK